MGAQVDRSSKESNAVAAAVTGDREGRKQLSLALAQIRHMMTLGEGMWAG